MESLSILYKYDRIGALDLHFGYMIERMAAQAHLPDPYLLGVTAALLSRERSKGNSCLFLDRVKDPFKPEMENEASATDLPQSFLDEVETHPFPPLCEWRRLLQSASDLVSDGSTVRPMVLDKEDRLYLYRYYRAEKSIASQIACLTQRIRNWPEIPDLAHLKKLFPQESSDSVSWQKIAALSAWRHRLCVITGGPGTGKTSTVLRILLLLLKASPRLRIGMAAPTGKAAIRLQQAVLQGMRMMSQLGIDRKSIPTEVSTVHRLLGYNGLLHTFRYGTREPLPYDVVVVDEASMLDVLLLNALLSALSESTRLILLGDRNQLPSVETGYAFSDICEAASIEHEYSEGFSEYCADCIGGKAVISTQRELAPCRPNQLGDTVVELRRNYRFAKESAIADLAQAVLNQDAQQAISLLTDSTKPSIGLSHTNGEPNVFIESKIGNCIPFGQIPEVYPADDSVDAQLERVLRVYLHIVELAQHGIKGQMETEKVLSHVFRSFDSARIFCATKNGVFGIYNTMRCLEQWMESTGRVSTDSEYYAGRPIMVTSNNYQLKLFNGDIGICWPGSTGEISVFFESIKSDGSPYYYRLPIRRLPDHQTAWAMTIHKAQGSQFNHIVMILPNESIPLLTRELLYTGITRASRTVLIFSRKEIIRSTILTTNHRYSGLSDSITRALHS